MTADTTDQARDARELTARIREVVDSFPSRVAAAKIAGVSPQQINNLINGKNAPSFMPLARMAIARGFSLEWVATGRAPKVATSTAHAVAPVLESFSRTMTTRLGATRMRVVLKVFDCLRSLYAEMSREPRHNDLQEAAIAIGELVAISAELDEHPEYDIAVGELAMRVHKQAHRLNAPSNGTVRK